MPQSKPQADNGTPEKKPGRKRKGAIHPSLKHLESACIDVDDGGKNLGESELANSGGDRFMLYRVGPKDVTKGRRIYLHTFDYTPTLEEIQKLFGGGEFWIQVFSNNGYAQGSPRIAIEGEPKIVKAESAEKMLETLPTSSDPIVNVLMQFMERLVDQMQEIRTGNQQAGGLTPERLRELVAVAQESQLTNQLIGMATSGPQSGSPDADAIAEKRFHSMLEVFKLGMETGRQSDGGGDTAGGLGSFAPLLEKLLSSPLLNQNPTAARQPGGSVERPGPAPVTATAAGAGDLAKLEADRAALESKVIEVRQDVLIQKLQRAIQTMLSAFEADVEYTDDQICGFVLQVLSVDEVRLVASYLTFEQVKAITVSLPEDQIALDNHKERVESILSELTKKFSG